MLCQGKYVAHFNQSSPSILLNKVPIFFKHYLYNPSADVPCTVTICRRLCSDLNTERKMTMIKGINKQILEVTNTEPPYFEKIIFFVKPESQQISESKLKDEAEKISTKLQRIPKSKRSPKQIARTVCYCVLGIGAGIALSYILNIVI